MLFQGITVIDPSFLIENTSQSSSLSYIFVGFFVFLIAICVYARLEDKKKEKIAKIKFKNSENNELSLTKEHLIELHDFSLKK